ncbi:MAG: hypothetical protein WCS65_10395 [Verrucomicrobiae bacterium]
MLFEILLVAGAGTLAFALRSFHHPVLFRAGTLGMVGASFLAGWLIGGSVFAGLVFASTWFLLPWLEILTRVRRMRLPLDRKISSCPPPARASFPDFDDLSSEMESGGFEHASDVGWAHDEIRHFYRLFLSSDRKTIGAICLVEQSAFTFYYIFFRSRTGDGRQVVTWNYPFSYGLHQFPGTQIQRVAGAQSALIGSHAGLVARGLGGDVCVVVPEAICEELENDLRVQLDHNLACGILCREGDLLIRYTLRGMFFLWFQFLRDFVRLS